MEYMLTFHILHMYVDKTQPRQFKFTFNNLFFLIRPVFFYFLVYGFLGRKNGSVGRKKKKKKNPQNISCQIVEKKLHGNGNKKC